MRNRSVNVITLYIAISIYQINQTTWKFVHALYFQFRTTMIEKIKKKRLAINRKKKHLRAEKERKQNPFKSWMISIAGMYRIWFCSIFFLCSFLVSFRLLASQNVNFIFVWNCFVCISVKLNFKHIPNSS